MGVKHGTDGNLSRGGRPRQCSRRRIDTVHSSRPPYFFLLCISNLDGAPSLQRSKLSNALGRNRSVGCLTVRQTVRVDDRECRTGWRSASPIRVRVMIRAFSIADLAVELALRLSGRLSLAVELPFCVVAYVAQRVAWFLRTLLVCALVEYGDRFVLAVEPPSYCRGIGRNE